MALRENPDDGGECGMKYAHLNRWKVTLTTESPVFIGASPQEKLSKRECVYDQGKGVLYVPDIVKLIETIEKQGNLNDFESFLLQVQSQQGDRISLREFLRNINIPISPDAPWVRYTLKTASGDYSTLNALHCFIKNAQGLPYIPGSSIKGAVRTALLAARSKEEELQSMIKNAEDKPKSRWSGPVENPLRVLRLNQRPEKETDAVNDLLRAMQVSDSAPCPLDSLVVCKKLELSSDGEVHGTSQGNRNRRSSPPLYRECLQPGTKTFFYLTIDQKLAGTQLSVTQITQALKSWYALQRQRYDDQFAWENVPLDGVEFSGVPIILGGGVGFQSKSLTYRLADPEETRTAVHNILKAQFCKTYKPHADDPAPYRMKIAQIGDRFYPMGHCSLQVEEA